MGQIALTVNGRSYLVGCDDGTEAHVRDLGDYLNSRVIELAGRLGQIGEARLLLMAALMISDDLAVALDRQADLTRQIEALRQTLAAGVDRETAAGIIARLERVADQLEEV